MFKRFMAMSVVAVMGVAMLASAADARPIGARPAVHATGRGRVINCIINRGTTHSSHLSGNRLLVWGKLKVINTSYRFTYDAGADVHVHTNRQIRHRVYHGTIQPRHYRNFPFRFILSYSPPNDNWFYNVKRCGLY